MPPLMTFKWISCLLLISVSGCGAFEARHDPRVHPQKHEVQSPQSRSNDDIRKNEDQNHVEALLKRKCYRCHRPDGNNHDAIRAMKDALDLQYLISEDFIVAGDAKSSYYWEVIEFDNMPPKKPLTSEEKKLIRSWIDQLQSEH